MTMMEVVVGVLGIKGETMTSNGEDLCGNNEMSKDSNNDDNGGSGGGVMDKMGIGEEKYIVTDTFLSYGLHMARRESKAHFVCRVCRMCCSKLVVNRNWWCGAGQMLESSLDGSRCIP
jgi:hypothetical protein